MLRFALKQLGFTVGTFVATSFLIFGALQLAPGSPLAALSGDRPLDPDQIRMLEARYHLDEPFFVRYLRWGGDLLQGDLGVSIIQNDTVANMVTARAGTTFSLVLYAALIIIALGLILGLIAGLTNKRTETAITTATTIALATPPFVYAVILVTIFAVSLKWFPSFGAGDGLLDRVWHLTLPALAMGLSGCALLSRIVRNSLKEEARREHVDTAWARGIPKNQIIRKHILRNSLVPTVTVAGLTVAALFSDTAIIETAFGIDGLGSMLVEAVHNKDFAVVQAVTMIIVGAFLATNLIVDMCYRFIDPRMAAEVAS